MSAAGDDPRLMQIVHGMLRQPSTSHALTQQLLQSASAIAAVSAESDEQEREKDADDAEDTDDDEEGLPPSAPSGDEA